MTQKEFIILLEQMCQKRFEKKGVAKFLQLALGLEQPIEINWNAYKNSDADYLTDYFATFSTYDIEGVPPELVGDFEIYYLKLKPNTEHMNVYVTEVSYEFERNESLAPQP